MIQIIRNYWQRLLLVSSASVVGAMMLSAPLAHATTPCNQQTFYNYTTGTCVGYIQGLLNFEGSYIHWAHWANNTVDNQFGPNTEAQVKYFQAYDHDNIDGIVGPLTWQGICVVGYNLKLSLPARAKDALQVQLTEVGC
jgi:peptidoglycan hydrolase-like protein with peptidoglycan-binding domain